jgi:N-acetylmuramate 1-kinase
MSANSIPTPTSPPAGNTTAPSAVNWPDLLRQTAFEAWLRGVTPAHQLQPASLRPASADASFRRYLRIDSATAGQGSFIIMDAPPDKENCHAFAQVDRLLAEAGLTVPQILAWDETHGFMLLDDLGHQTMMDVIQPDKPEANQALYTQAIDALLAWQLASRPGVLPVYDEALLQRELSLFPDWYVREHRGMTLDDQQTRTLQAQFRLLVERNLMAPQVYVHRDFMPRNLMILSDQARAQRAGKGSALGVLDFQDAVYGPSTYDIASLMRDAFLSWDEEFVLDMIVRYWEKARKAGLMDFDGWHGDFGAFYRAVEWMGLQRHRCPALHPLHPHHRPPLH